jgi:indole-3-glycerol phosphate synthase
VDILRKIIDAKRARIETAKVHDPITAVHEKALLVRETAIHRALSKALIQSDGLNVIAEFKRRSPSKGVISNSANPIKTAQSYAAGGAAAISVLTEEDFFDGTLADLQDVKTTVSVPVLRKDFIVDEYQVFESAAAGADALLLIVAALEDTLLKRLRVLAEDQLTMDALVEVHTKDEMMRALDCGATLVGVNNRDLKTFNVSLATSELIARDAAPNVTLVSESGLKSKSDLQRLRALGYRGFLIGESLMISGDPESALRELIAPQP